MAKSKVTFVCENCGAVSLKWYGKCPSCGEWNTLVENEEIEPVKQRNKLITNKAAFEPLKMNLIETCEEERYKTGLRELDRVLGGGLVKGSVVLLGGDPGIGKSTILLQVCKLIEQKLKILYVSGEESKRQLKLRALRLCVDNDNLFVVTKSDIESIIETIKMQKPDLVMIDSIQTMSLESLSSSPGSITQVRECTSALMRTAKILDIPVIIVSHVNKGGAIAGPKVLEHIVDAVLYFEGDRQLPYRILRAIKNRYGSTNEIGVFEMEDKGLSEVANPSMALLSGRPLNVAGTCVACAMEGTRPILSEVQALATTTGFGTPRRMCAGFDHNRLSLIVAVLEKRAGFFFSSSDIYINIVGGLRLYEPAVDLAIAVSLISSIKDTVIEPDCVVIGEIGLAGEIRSVPNVLSRISEAARLGFKKCVIPYQNFKKIKNNENLSIKLIGVKDIRQAFLSVCQG